MDGILLKNGERKVPYDAWRNAVLREGMKGVVVRAFAELRFKRTLSVLHVDEDEILRREMHLEPCHEPLSGAPAGNVWMFREFLRTGDVIDVGEGGILWDSTVRYGLVCERSNVLWLDGGREEQVTKALDELDRIVRVQGNGCRPQTFHHAVD
ncbi:MAG: hypothetical protein ACP5UZ_08830 [Thermoplasmata archaeon]